MFKGKIIIRLERKRKRRRRRKMKERIEKRENFDGEKREEEG